MTVTVYGEGLPPIDHRDIANVEVTPVGALLIWKAMGGRVWPIRGYAPGTWTAFVTKEELNAPTQSS